MTNKDGGYSELFNAILNSKHREILGINNSSCIKCESVEKQMLSVGAFTMCYKCYQEEFGETDTPITNNREIYQNWYKKWEEQEY